MAPQFNHIPRALDLTKLLQQKSFFLFGQRGVGKSSLVREQLPSAAVFDLLKASTFDRLSRRPELIGEESPDSSIVVIDEIQKLPRLLDEVHRLIEEQGKRFLLTGSSARKLRRGAANLLAGRAWEARLFPLTTAELKDEFDLGKYLCVGGLPGVYLSKYPFEELKAYTGTYLREEIVAEAAVRKYESFVNFLDLIAAKVGEEVNMNSLASDCGVSPKSVAAFLRLLEDTLIGFELPVYRKTKQRKSSARSKFYLSDIGITNSLLGRKEVPQRTDAFGSCFEHFIILELRAYLSYQRRDEQLSFWRTHTGFEVDCLVGEKLAVEVKSTDLVQDRHLKSLRALREEGLIERYAIVSRDESERIVDGISIYPWRIFLEKLWSGELF